MSEKKMTVDVIPQQTCHKHQFTPMIHFGYSRSTTSSNNRCRSEILLIDHASNYTRSSIPNNMP